MTLHVRDHRNEEPPIRNGKRSIPRGTYLRATTPRHGPAVRRPSVAAIARTPGMRARVTTPAGAVAAPLPPPQVVGSTFKTHFEMRDGVPVIAIDPEIDNFDDKAAKPAAIAKYIGRQPIACFGNSDGDREMLQDLTAAAVNSALANAQRLVQEEMQKASAGLGLPLASGAKPA